MLEVQKEVFECIGGTGATQSALHTLQTQVVNQWPDVSIINVLCVAAFAIVKCNISSTSGVFTIQEIFHEGPTAFSYFTILKNTLREIR